MQNLCFYISMNIQVQILLCGCRNLYYTFYQLTNYIIKKVVWYAPEQSFGTMSFNNILNHTKDMAHKLKSFQHILNFILLYKTDAIFLLHMHKILYLNGCAWCLQWQ
jgi:hypothetical protein